jgi:hypothetical protein
MAQGRSGQNKEHQGEPGFREAMCPDSEALSIPEAMFAFAVAVRTKSSSRGSAVMRIPETLRTSPC